MLLLAALLLGNTPLMAQDTAHSKLSVLPVPAFGYSPETKINGGAVCLFNKKLGKDTITRSSNAKIKFTYTQRKQIIAEIGWNVFTPGERMYLNGRIHISRFPDYFWQRNDSNTVEERITYSSSRRLIDANFFFRVHSQKKWFIGPMFRLAQFKHVQELDAARNRLQVGDMVQGSLAGLGILHDTRNQLLQATKGVYLLATSQLMGGSHRIYARNELDIRTYISRKKTTLALRSKTLQSRGPLLDAAVFGGDETARGFYLGRYRPEMFSTLQAEFRFTIYRRWAWSFFGGNSALIYAEKSDNFFAWNAGTGMRFLIDRAENINLRLDMAWGRYGNSGFYVAFGESF